MTTATAMAPAAHAAEQPAPRASRLRLEIQAGRAIAIGAVVLNHFSARLLPGGYVGVDIFFVISGFLITGHIAKPVSQGRFSFRAFYTRRAWRLLPAALLTLLATVILTWLFVPETLWSEFGQQIAASALYFENWMLAANSVDYSAPNANSSLVQHFWSLSTEEQFYAVWPLILFACALIARRTGHLRGVFAVALGAVFAASLAYSVYLTAHSPAAYFATTTRGWEFAAGGLLWLLVDRIRLADAWRSAASWLGLAIIVFTLFDFNASTPFPSATALLPVVGISLIIVGGMPTARWAPTRLYGLRPVQWLGDVSYSLYLWHWPLLLIVPYVLHLAPGQHTPRVAKIAVLLLALVVAWASRRGIEQPLIAWSSERLRTRRVRYSVMLAAAVAGMLVIATPASALDMVATRAATPVAVSGNPLVSKHCVGAAALLPGASCGVTAKAKIVPSPVAANNDTISRGSTAACQARGGDSALNPCHFGTSAKKAKVHIALVGDSHAANWQPALAAIATAHGWSLTTYLHSACPLTTAKLPKGCSTWRDNVLSTLLADKYDVVFVAAFSAVPYPHQTQIPTKSSLTASMKSAAAHGFSTAWKQLQGVGSKVVDIRDNPDPSIAGIHDVPTCVAQYGDSTHCSFSQAKGVLTDSAFYAAQHTPGVSAIDLTSSFCKNGTCRGVVGGVIVYRQLQHLTGTYVRTISPMLDKKVLPIVKAAVAKKR